MEQTIYLPCLAIQSTLKGITFYVIEIFPEPNFVTTEDGNIKAFDTYAEAFAEAADCQDGLVIGL